ncbi:MAG: GAF domain-containing protein [Chloroflexi bacterium]|nr:MAG: GAF domain-containing protein [Chloroflexota bacterium]
MTSEGLAPQRHPLSTISIRVRTGFIFFLGIFLLVVITISIANGVSRTIDEDTAVLATLSHIKTQINQTTAGAASSQLDIEQSLLLLLHGNANRPPADDALVIEPLEQAITLLPVYQQAVIDVQQQTGDTAVYQQLQTIDQSLADSLNQATLAVQTRQDANTGMVRGMYATLFVSTVIILLVGLWYTEQIIVAPVEALNQVADRIALGDLETEVNLGGQGEFHTLANSFEIMRLRLQQSRGQLLEAADTLETHVAQRTRQLSALSRVITTASRSLDQNEVMLTALEQSLQVMGVEMGGLWLVDPEVPQIRLIAAHNMPDSMRIQVGVMAFGEGATGRAAQTGEIVVVEDIKSNPNAVKGTAVQSGLRSLVAIPIRAHDTVLGVLDVMTRTHRTYSPEELALLRSIGEQIGITLDGLQSMQESRRQANQVAILEERERISAELHDGLLQTLGYLYLQLDQMKDTQLPQYSQQLTRLCTVLEAASQEGRAYINDLRETPPPPAPLQAALQTLFNTFHEEYNLEINLDLDDRPILMDKDRITNLEKIAREALLNAVRHGQANTISLSCHHLGADGELLIVDDGVGFVPGVRPEDGRKHFGLSILQARAERIGGELTIDSSPGNGTRITVNWPLESDDE